MPTGLLQTSIYSPFGEKEGLRKDLGKIALCCRGFSNCIQWRLVIVVTFCIYQENGCIYKALCTDVNDVPICNTTVPSDAYW